MTLYHGSDHMIAKPVYQGGKRNNDYGYGFYCTEYPDMAREWAALPEANGYLNSYEIDTGQLSVLELGGYSVLVWLTILLENRTFQIDSPLAKEAYSYLTKEFHIDYDDYDIIIGYRADDSYFSFARDFINGTISVSQLSRAMHLENMGNQVVIRSKKAFDRLRFTGSEEVDSRIWYPKRIARDVKAREKYSSTDCNTYIRGDIYITRIIDEENKQDDLRIQ